MKSFNKWLEQRQTEWRKANVASQEWGRQNGVQKPWILPYGLWKEGLWPGIRTSLPAYLKHADVQKHTGVHNLKSSWTLCANLYFPFRAPAEDRALFASFLKRYVAGEINTLEKIELEFAEDKGSKLEPYSLLGEEDGTRGANQTSPDLGLRVNNGRGLVLVENKLTERNFSQCSAWRHKGNSRRCGNPCPERCNRAVDIVRDHTNQCHQTTWGRTYWEHLAPVTDEKVLANLPNCPASRGGYQLFRQHALAEGIAQSGHYDFVVSAIAVDERNPYLDAALLRSGIDGLKGWGEIFKGKSRFAVFTHQQWVGWVQEHNADGRWGDWLNWVRSRYGLGG